MTQLHNENNDRKQAERVVGRPTVTRADEYFAIF